jgi:4-hydroxy-3-polyprenylbenzoate decarboxylase
MSEGDLAGDVARGRDAAAMKRLAQVSDLRTWIDLMTELGEIETVTGADWDLEIGAVSEANYQRPNPPALLFDEVTGYQPGQRIVTASVSTARRLGIALRIGLNETDASLLDVLGSAPGRWAARAADFPARWVDSSPVTENVVEGDKIDLAAFPVPRWHEHDGGRYIGTGDITMTSNPATGVVNGGCYRIQLQDEGRGATVNIVPGKHGAQNAEAWFAKEGRAPVVISYGHDPLLFMLAGINVPAGVSELDYAGAILGQPVDVLRADNGLPIPASSELAVEGWIYPDRVADEGPFGEWTGYYSKSSKAAYLMEMTKLYHRGDAIQLGAPPGLPPHDYTYMRGAMNAAMVLDGLRGMAAAGVQGVWAHDAGGGRLLLTVSVDTRYPGHARQIGYLTSQGPAGAYMNRYVIVVDDDIDPRNLDQVMWAVCTRSDPEKDIDILKRTWGGGANPLHVPGEPAYMSRAIIDATVPYERKGKFPLVARSSAATLDAVRGKWPHLFGESR